MTRKQTIFQRLRAKARTGILLEGAAVMTATFAVYMGVSFLVDRTLRLELGYRAGLLLAVLAALGWIAYRRVFKPIRVELGDDEMALAVERGDPQAKQALISAVQFERDLARGQEVVESRAMMTRVVDDVEQGIDKLEAHRALDGKRVAKFVALLVCVVGIVATWVVFDTANVKLWAMRNLGLSSAEWPRYTQLSFAEVSRRVPEAEDVTIKVKAEGVKPEQVYLHYEFAGGEEGSDLMSMTGDSEFTFTLESLLENVQLYATGADGLTETIDIEVVGRPRIEGLQIELEYPDYMKKETALLPATEADIKVPHGAVVKFQGRSTKDLEAVTLIVGQEQDRKVPMQVAAGKRAFAGTYEPQKTGLVRIEVVDLDKLDSAQPPKIFLRLVPDREPKVEFKVSEVGSMLTPHALIPGQLKVRDDYGLTHVAAQWRLTGAPEDEQGQPTDQPKETPWQEAQLLGLDGFDPAARAILYEDRVGFDLRPMNPSPDFADPKNTVFPGQFLSLKFYAKDNFGPGEPHTGEADVLTFRIVTREKLIEDLTRRQSEQRREVMQVLTEERGDVAMLREIMSPADTTQEAAKLERARRRIRALSREQRALGRRIGGVATRYELILNEYLHNRILEPNKVSVLTQQIVEPLRTLAKEDFPNSAVAVQEFSETGKEDVRDVAVASYESIIQRLQVVLEQMKEVENFAALLEYLRQVMKLQDAAISGAKSERDASLGDLLNPDGPDKGKKDDDKDNAPGAPGGQPKTKKKGSGN